MSNTLSKLKNFIKNNWGKVLVAFAAAMLGLIYFSGVFSSGNKNLNSTTSPTRETIQELVEVSGTVEPAKDAKMSFDKSGTVASLNVKVGDRVRVGQVLATLSYADAYSSVREAEAGVVQAQANLDLVAGGTTQAELDLKQNSVDLAKNDLNNVIAQSEDNIRNIQNTVNDIVTVKLSQFFLKDGNGYKMSFITCDQGAQGQLEITRNGLDNIQISSLDSAYEFAQRLNIFLASLNNILTLPCAITDTTLSDRRLAISGLRISINSIFSEISGRKSAILSATNNLTRAERDLAFAKTKTDPNKIKTAEAGVTQANARLYSARSQLSKNILVAPFNGMVSEVNVSQGEMANSSKAAVVLLSDSAFQIKTKIAEVDIAKLKVGQLATVTLDAYYDVPFMATISRINPAATTEGGAARYGVYLTFIQKDERIKSGMTANAKILTTTKENALVLSPSYIKIKSGGGIVNVINGSTTEEVIVKTGIRGANGKVEILEGLNEKSIVKELQKETGSSATAL